MQKQQLLFPRPFPVMTGIRRVCDLPPDDQPIYRIKQVGARAMASQELLSLVIGSQQSYGLAGDLLATFGSLSEIANQPTITLTKVHGIGNAAAARIKAALELGRRTTTPKQLEQKPIHSPADAANIMMPSLLHKTQEEFHVICLSTRATVLAIVHLYTGSLNSCAIRVAEVFHCAIQHNAASIIAVHNHPSGSLTPSVEDINITRSLVQAGKLLDITVYDHLIVANGQFTSMREKGMGFDY